MCNNNNHGNYHRLDSSRDTEAEVETAIRFFPNVLTRYKEVAWVDEDYSYYFYPLQLLAFTRHEDDTWWCSLKVVSFIPLLARLAIELGLFEEQERGGLLCQDIDSKNILENLMGSDPTEIDNREHHEPVDDEYLNFLIDLRKLGLIKKEDIQRYGLLHKLCHQNCYFSEKRFRFLVEWDPNALIHPQQKWITATSSRCNQHEIFNSRI